MPGVAYFKKKGRKNKKRKEIQSQSPSVTGTDMEHVKLRASVISNGTDKVPCQRVRRVYIRPRGQKKGTQMEKKIKEEIDRVRKRERQRNVTLAGGCSASNF